jgi:hypothetical protein
MEARVTEELEEVRGRLEKIGANTPSSNFVAYVSGIDTEVR